MSVRQDIVEDLKTALQVLQDSDDYEVRAHKITDWYENYQKIPKSQTPLVMAIDMGNDQRLEYDSTHSTFSFNVDLWLYVVDASWKQVQDALNGISASVKEWIYSGPDVGTNALSINYVEESRWQEKRDEQHSHGCVIMRTKIIYWCTNGTF